MMPDERVLPPEYVSVLVMRLAGRVQTKVTMRDRSANHLFSGKHQAWIILGVPKLLCNSNTGVSPSAPEHISVNTSRNDFPRHKERRDKGGKHSCQWAACHISHERPRTWRCSIRLPAHQRLCPSHYFWNNSGAGTINTALVGFVELMTSCFSGLWNWVRAKISKIGSWI